MPTVRPLAAALALFVCLLGGQPAAASKSERYTRNPRNPTRGRRLVSRSTHVSNTSADRFAPIKNRDLPWLSVLPDRMVKTLVEPLHLGSRVPQSRAFKARGIQLRGGKQVSQPFRIDIGYRGKKPVLTIHWRHPVGRKGAALDFLQRQYVELTNATALTTHDARGGEHEFLFVRAVRPYETIVDEKGRISTKNYCSDVVLFERVSTRTKSGRLKTRWEPLERILTTRSDEGYVVEDPRVFVDWVDGRRQVYLAYSEVATHLRGSRQRDVMNRVVRLSVGRDGVPKKPRRQPRSLERGATYLGPKPRRTRHGPLSVMAKNGMFHVNELGQVVVRTRFLLDFGHPAVRALAGRRRWKYAEQAYVFASREDFWGYDWDRYALEDLFADATARRRGRKRVRPLMATVLITDRELREHFDPSAVIDREGKGLGPGTAPVRLRREGNRVYVSEAHGAPERLGAIVPRRLQNSYALADGEVKFVTFDHQVRFFADRGLRKRHYSTAIKLFDHTLTKIDAYYADAIQPRQWYQRTAFSGIFDLHHLYPVGRTIKCRPDGRSATIRVYAGTSDAHVAQFDFDLGRLLAELSPGSARWQGGPNAQIYKPKTPWGWARSRVDLTDAR